MGLLVTECNKARRGRIHEVLQLHCGPGESQQRGDIEHELHDEEQRRNREGETPYHGMMHWTPVMSLDVQRQNVIVALC